MTTQIKPGGKSTEFLLVSLVTIAGLTTTYFAGTVWAEIAGIIVAGGLVLGYSANRSSVKRLQVAGQVAAAERVDVMTMNREQAAAEYAARNPGATR